MTPQLALSMFLIRERKKLLSGNYSSVRNYMSIDVHAIVWSVFEMGSNAVQPTLNLLWRQG